MPSHYTVRPIGKNTFAIEEKTYLTQGLCYLLLGEEKALLIDTGFGLEGFAQTVKGLTGLPVTVANTHAHADHIGGNHFYDEIWYHEADRRIFALHTDLRYTLAMLGEGIPQMQCGEAGLTPEKMLRIDAGGSYRYFTDGHVFRLGGRDVEALHTPGHTPGSVCFLDRASRMLFSGDTVCERGVLLSLADEACEPAVFLASLERLKGLWDAFDTLWPGHHGFPAEKSYIDEYLACARLITQGGAEYGVSKGRRCVRCGRVLITLPGEAPNGKAPNGREK